MNRGRAGRTAVLLALVLALPAMLGLGDSAESRNRRGNQHYRDGKFDEALAEYRSAQVQKPELRQLFFNSGDALFRKGELPNALREFERASAASDSVLAGDAFFNAGNAFLQMGDIGSAIESYKAALMSNPADADAKHNLELALELMQQQQQQEQDQQDGQDEQQEQNQQDGQDEQQDQQDGQEEQQNEQEDQQGEDEQQDQQGEEDQQDQQSEAGQEEGQQGEQEEQAAMSREEAERLLDAIEEAEEELQAELRAATATKRKKVDKDW